MKLCQACLEDSLISCDGDIVCQLCGLVDSQDISDECCENIHHVNHCYTYHNDKDIQKACDVLNIPEIIGNLATRMCHSNKRKLKASLLYTACQMQGFNVSKESIAYGFQLDKTSISKDVSSMNKPHMNHRLFPVLENLRFDKRTILQIIGHVTSIEKKLLKNHVFVSKKPSKTDGVMVYYVCMYTLEMNINKKDVMSTCHISPTTFSKNLKIIQDILKT